MCDCVTCHKGIIVQAEPETLETWELFHLLDQALRSARLGEALKFADAICVPEKAELGKKSFPFPIRDYYEVMRIYPQDMIQGVDDRVEQYNLFASHRHIE